MQGVLPKLKEKIKAYLNKRKKNRAGTITASNEPKQTEIHVIQTSFPPEIDNPKAEEEEAKGGDNEIESARSQAKAQHPAINHVSEKWSFL